MDGTPFEQLINLVSTFRPKRNDDITKIIQKYPGILEQTNESQATPLFYATEGDHTITKLLLDSGADPNHKDDQGKTPLYSAVINDQPKICEVLLDNGADPNHKDNQGKTPLHYACEFMNTGVVRLLLEHHAKPNHKDNQGKTPLHYATQGDPNIVRLLLKHGANPLIKDNSGNDPISIATDQEILDLLHARTIEIVDKTPPYLISQFLFGSRRSKRSKRRSKRSKRSRRSKRRKV